MNYELAHEEAFVSSGLVCVCVCRHPTSDLVLAFATGCYYTAGSMNPLVSSSNGSFSKLELCTM